MIDVHNVTIDCAQPYELATFWSSATGWEIHPGDGKEDDEVLLQGAFDLLFIRVPDGKSVKNRIHLDVTGTDGTTRDQEVERLLGLGATIHDDRREPTGVGWVTMLDPEGNEFCVCRAEYERARQHLPE
ncbi:VOC family protein [Streptosporangium sp. NBC_01756]|uniref:VOC family protein n=1 Tax=Streptosporangium sp. NBC_01756 TaxID=2975950 RepID=UPI002DDB1F86|nr:VOC family protein [Streptosporangium sp. NBC_01756]WSC89822.1 VOC family protein [Streptosporangium sp. NBC_01756]